jgi:DNA-binding transcriptional LysR family regulator
MNPNLDVDLLKTFIAIAETGSFTRAAEEVHKTQGAVSMQMKRLEEILERALFVREGRQSKLTGDGERLLDFARRIVRLNDEAVVTFARPELSGVIRFGVPDDYADTVLPELMARFARTHPLVEVDVDCQGSDVLAALTREGKKDLSLISATVGTPGIEVVRREPLVGSLPFAIMCMRTRSFRSPSLRSAARGAKIRSSSSTKATGATGSPMQAPIRVRSRLPFSLASRLEPFRA